MFLTKRNSGYRAAPETDTQRLIRMETRLSRLAEELGIDVADSPDWLTLDEPSRTIYISSLGRSLRVINDVAKKRGAAQIGKSYDIVYKGETIGTLVLF